MRDYLLKHELSRGGRLWCDRVIQGVERGERTAMRLYGEAMKWVGAQGSIAAVFIASLNVRSEDELRSLVESGRKLERLSADSATSLEEYRESALDLLRSVLQQKPEWRNLVLARLGSHAQEEPEQAPGQNGGANGSVVKQERESPSAGTEGVSG